jgi:hypothetical protein
MVSIEEVITQLKRLTPEQVDDVARIIHGLSCAERPAAPRHSALPDHLIHAAVQHGWPAQLFAEVIGSLPDLVRGDQPLVENRPNL